MPKFIVSASISKPVADVWSTLTNFTMAHHWMNGIDSMRLIGPLQRDAIVAFSTRGKLHQSCISEIVDEQLLELTSVQGKVTAVYRYSLVSNGQSTTVTLHAQCSGSGLMVLLMPFLGWVIKKTDGGQMLSLKALMER